MMTVDYFEKMASNENERIEKLNADYRRLVSEIAAGKEPKPEKVKALLVDVGKSMDELKADVAGRLRRAELKALVAKRPEIDRQIAAVNAMRVEANRVFGEAEAAYIATMEPLDEQYDEACRQQSEAINAAAELADKCDDPELIRERNEIDAELASVSEAIPKWREQAERQEKEFERYKEKAEKQVNLPADQRSYEALAEKYRVEAEKYRGEVRKLERQWNSLQNRRDSLRLRMQQA